MKGRKDRRKKEHAKEHPFDRTVPQGPPVLLEKLFLFVYVGPVRINVLARVSNDVVVTIQYLKKSEYFFRFHRNSCPEIETSYLKIRKSLSLPPLGVSINAGSKIFGFYSFGLSLHVLGIRSSSGRG
jgi:hypothetical protein